MIYAMLFLCLFTEKGIDDVLAMEAHDLKNYLEQNEIKPYEYGIDLVVVHARPTDARHFFKKLIQAYEGEDQNRLWFGLAWVEYSMGELDDSLDHVDFMLERTWSKLLKARAYYLIGLIHIAWSELQVATAYLEESLSDYRALGRKGGANLCLEQLANIASIKEDPEEALRLYQEVDTLGLSESFREMSTAYKYLHAASNHFKKGDFAEALTACEKAELLYNGAGNEIMLAWTRARMGLCHAMMGNFKEAQSFANEVQSNARRFKIKNLEHYNNLTRIRIRKCKGYSTASLQVAMRTWARDNHAKMFLKLADYVDKTSCDD